MLKLDDYRAIFIAAALIGILLLVSPTLSLVLHTSGGEEFSALWILGSEDMAENYPLNIRTNEAYKVLVGVENHMGHSCYYAVYVKFRHKSEPLPDVGNGMPSSLPPLLKYHVFLSNGECWEKDVIFSFSGVSFEDNVCRCEYLKVNGSSSFVNKTVEWNNESSGYYYNLFFELWRYDSASGDFQYHNRFVGFWLNATG